MEILEKSPLRYKVNITSTEDHDNVFPGIVGWIDKSICSVFSRHYYDENNKSYIKTLFPTGFEIEFRENIRVAT